LGKFQDAYKHFARAAGPVMGNLNTGRMLERFGRDEDAIRYYEDARRIDPSCTFALRRLADLHKRTGNHEQAQAVSNVLSNITVAASGR
jgi:tetratricopeptide (TPR) repeat protein